MTDLHTVISTIMQPKELFPRGHVRVLCLVCPCGYYWLNSSVISPIYTVNVKPYNDLGIKHVCKV